MDELPRLTEWQLGLLLRRRQESTIAYSTYYVIDSIRIYKYYLINLSRIKIGFPVVTQANTMPTASESVYHDCRRSIEKIIQIRSSTILSQDFPLVSDDGLGIFDGKVEGLDTSGSLVGRREFR